jgi:hypothetical protein
MATKFEDIIKAPKGEYFVGLSIKTWRADATLQVDLEAKYVFRRLE